MAEPKPSIQQLVETLDLEPHVEGGYFKQTFKADAQPLINTPKGTRVTMTSIYYLLSADSPIGHFHRNTSDIMHYFHAGDPITYYLIHPDGTLQTKVLGPDVLAGHEYQFVVKGGVWKASSISPQGQNGYGLIGEAVAPGFEYTDMELANRQVLREKFPQHASLITRLTREH
ncbi:cupin domain-containing protein [Aliiglaciecola sp. 3_MG-2023]|nr:cupin domain-containing protein [Aliiglaciecola sp. 3_MG-2023]